MQNLCSISPTVSNNKITNSFQTIFISFLMISPAQTPIMGTKTLVNVLGGSMTRTNHTGRPADPLAWVWLFTFNNLVTFQNANRCSSRSGRVSWPLGKIILCCGGVVVALGVAKLVYGLRRGGWKGLIGTRKSFFYASWSYTGCWLISIKFKNVFSNCQISLN